MPSPSILTNASNGRKEAISDSENLNLFLTLAISVSSTARTSFSEELAKTSPEIWASR